MYCKYVVNHELGRMCRELLLLPQHLNVCHKLSCTCRNNSEPKRPMAPSTPPHWRLLCGVMQQRWTTNKWQLQQRNLCFKVNNMTTGERHSKTIELFPVSTRLHTPHPAQMPAASMSLAVWLSFRSVGTVSYLRNKTGLLRSCLGSDQVRSDPERLMTIRARHCLPA